MMCQPWTCNSKRDRYGVLVKWPTIRELFGLLGFGSEPGCVDLL